MVKRLLWLGLWWGMLAGLLRAGPLVEVVEAVGLAELAATFDTEKVDRILGAAGAGIEGVEERGAAATLVAVGMGSNVAWDQPEVVARMVREWGDPQIEQDAVWEMPLARPVGLMRVKAMGGHAALRRDEALMAALDAAVGEGVLTGYGLRSRGVSDTTDAARTVIYSHSSLAHVKQLVGLVASEGIAGRVMIAPKVAAFVFRDGWGERPDWINELGDGIYVAQGPEMLVHFEFDEPAMVQRFDALVERYAKKDSSDETGNLVRSWWQPFYYVEGEAEGYAKISRVTLLGEEVEASLLMLPEREALVRDHFAEAAWAMEVDAIWVSQAFYRFLEGDFR